ncbi:MAG: hypothetical protein SCM96_15115 [Acidobacteriota bacterium]|nr:hypothetical protein [Acidobacteriota bacterium]
MFNSCRHKGFLIATLLILVSVVVVLASGDKNVPVIEGSYDYVANYEIGKKAGTQTQGHKFIVTSNEGIHYLHWGKLKVEAKRVANGLIYEWKLDEAQGQGIYMFHDDCRNVFGTFHITDKEGFHSGTTVGKKSK